MTYKYIQISYPINQLELGDLDDIFSILAGRCVGVYVGGFYEDGTRHITYAFPADDYDRCEEFIKIIKRLNNLKIKRITNG